MKVFIVGPVFRRGNYVFRDVVPVKYSEPLWVFDGRAKGDEWLRAQPAVRLSGGKRKKVADFAACVPQSTIAMVDRLDARISEIIRSCGELLPVTSDSGVPISILNIFPLADAGRRLGDASKPLFDDRYEFDPEKLPQRSLFKLRGSTWPLFASQGVVPQDEEFKATVERDGLTGLEFREVWNDDGSELDIPSFPADVVRTTPGFGARRGRS